VPQEVAAKGGEGAQFWARLRSGIMKMSGPVMPNPSRSCAPIETRHAEGDGRVQIRRCGRVTRRFFSDYYYYYCFCCVPKLTCLPPRFALTSAAQPKSFSMSTSSPPSLADRTGGEASTGKLTRALWECRRATRDMVRRVKRCNQGLGKLPTARIATNKKRWWWWWRWR
jgi:hypothetical protein